MQTSATCKVFYAHVMGGQAKKLTSLKTHLPAYMYMYMHVACRCTWVQSSIVATSIVGTGQGEPRSLSVAAVIVMKS